MDGRKMLNGMSEVNNDLIEESEAAFDVVRKNFLIRKWEAITSTRRRKIVNAVCVIMAIIICVGSFHLGKRAAKAKDVGIDISKEFFVESSREKIKEVTVKNNESVNIDGIIYTLESSIYVKDCNIGYYVISIRQEDGKTDIISSFDYEFQLISAGGRFEKREFCGNVLYFSFAQAKDMYEEGVLEIICQLAQTESELGFVRFNLENSENIPVKVFQNDIYECTFSAIGFSVLHDDSEEITEVEIEYENGDDSTLFYFPLEDIRNGNEDFDNIIIRDTSVGWEYFSDDSWNTPEGKNRFNYTLDKWYEVEKIKSVTVNGEKLTAE